MSVENAMKIITSKFPNMVVIECLEFADFYAFALVEEGFEDEPFGGGYDTVNKNTGEVGGFNPAQDFKAFFAAKSINIDTFN